MNMNDFLSKRFFSFRFILILIIIFFIFLVFILSSIKDRNNLNGKLFKILNFLGDIPQNIMNIKIVNGELVNKSDIPILDKAKNDNLDNLVIFKPYVTDDLILISRYDPEKYGSIIEVRNVSNLDLIFSFRPNVEKILESVDHNLEINKDLKVNNSKIRFEFIHPLLTKELSIITHAEYGPLFKIDRCNNIEWMNDKFNFHHSINYSYDGNIWIPIRFNPYSETVSKYIKKFGFTDDGIAKVDINSGQLLYTKSIIELLIENKIFYESDFFSKNKSYDPIHVNSIIEIPANSKVWNKGDLLLSINHLSSIIHYRPSTNKVINYIKGPFFQQHDINIINDHTIAFFNNNEKIDPSYIPRQDEQSSIMFYDFLTNEFRTKLIKLPNARVFKTWSQGIVDFTDTNAYFVEEQNQGRLIFFDENDDLIWILTNKKDNNYYPFSWSRLINDKNLIENIILNKNESCIHLTK